MAEPEIQAYYERNAKRDRLASGARRVEFLRVCELLERHLPPSPATILDVGGGAGVYALPEPLVEGAGEGLQARAHGPVFVALDGDVHALCAFGD